MTNQQGLPEALRHAADIEHWARCDNGLRGTELRASAATLRRLHAQVEELSAAQAELAAIRAGGEPVAYLWQHGETGRTRVAMPDQLFTDSRGWGFVGPLYTHPSPPEGMAGWKPIADAPEDEPVLLWSEIKGGAPILDAWGRYMQYNQPQFTHFMLVRPPLASEAKEPK